MKTIQNKITSIDSLSKEIYLLNERKNHLENQFSENWDHLQHNFPILLRNSIFKKAEKKANSNWVYSVQEAVGNATEKVAVKLEEVLLYWFDKYLLHKKEE